MRRSIGYLQQIPADRIFTALDRQITANDLLLPLSALADSPADGAPVCASVDVFWGTGATAEAIAGDMRNPGELYLVLPK